MGLDFKRLTSSLTKKSECSSEVSATATVAPEAPTMKSKKATFGGFGFLNASAASGHAAKKQQASTDGVPGVPTATVAAAPRKSAADALREANAAREQLQQQQQARAAEKEAEEKSKSSAQVPDGDASVAAPAKSSASKTRRQTRTRARRNGGGRANRSSPRQRASAKREAELTDDELKSSDSVKRTRSSRSRSRPSRDKEAAREQDEDDDVQNLTIHELLTRCRFEGCLGCDAMGADDGAFVRVGLVHTLMALAPFYLTLFRLYKSDFAKPPSAAVSDDARDARLAPVRALFEQFGLHWEHCCSPLRYAFESRRVLGNRDVPLAPLLCPNVRRALESCWSVLIMRHDRSSGGRALLGGSIMNNFFNYVVCGSIAFVHERQARLMASLRDGTLLDGVPTLAELEREFVDGVRSESQRNLFATLAAQLCSPQYALHHCAQFHRHQSFNRTHINLLRSSAIEQRLEGKVNEFELAFDTSAAALEKFEHGVCVQLLRAGQCRSAHDYYWPLSLRHTVEPFQLHIDEAQRAVKLVQRGMQLTPPRLSQRERNDVNARALLFTPTTEDDDDDDEETRASAEFEDDYGSAPSPSPPLGALTASSVRTGALQSLDRSLTGGSAQSDDEEDDDETSTTRALREQFSGTSLDEPFDKPTMFTVLAFFRANVDARFEVLCERPQQQEQRRRRAPLRDDREAMTQSAPSHFLSLRSQNHREHIGVDLGVFQPFSPSTATAPINAPPPMPVPTVNAGGNVVHSALLRQNSPPGLGFSPERRVRQFMTFGRSNNDDVDTLMDNALWDTHSMF